MTLRISQKYERIYASFKRIEATAPFVKRCNLRGFVLRGFAQLQLALSKWLCWLTNHGRRHTFEFEALLNLRKINS